MLRFYSDISFVNIEAWWSLYAYPPWKTKASSRLCKDHFHQPTSFDYWLLTKDYWLEIVTSFHKSRGCKMAAISEDCQHKINTGHDQGWFAQLNWALLGLITHWAPCSMGRRFLERIPGRDVVQPDLENTFTKVALNDIEHSSWNAEVEEVRNYSVSPRGITSFLQFKIYRQNCPFTNASRTVVSRRNKLSWVEHSEQNSH